MLLAFLYYDTNEKDLCFSWQSRKQGVVVYYRNLIGFKTTRKQYI